MAEELARHWGGVFEAKGVEEDLLDRWLEEVLGGADGDPGGPG